MVQQLSTNTFGVAKWIVSATASDGTHTTIASAITSASAGDTIFIRPGTYTENLTLKDGVNLAAFASEFNATASVTILGQASLSTGTVNIERISLKTNSNPVVNLTGGNLNLVQCYINSTNAAPFLLSAGNLNLFQCNAIDTNTGSIFVATVTATVLMNSCYFLSTGTTASSFATGTNLEIYNSKFQGAITTAGTAIVNLKNSIFGVGNITTLTTAGTGVSTAYNCSFISGTSSAISVGSGTTLQISQCVISSSNTNAITGAGTLQYSAVSFDGTSSKINTTTLTARNIDTGGISFDGGTNILRTFTQGTFSPTIRGASTAGTVAMVTQVGRYQATGRLVTVYVHASWTTIGGATGAIQCNNLPFTAVNVTNATSSSLCLSSSAAILTTAASAVPFFEVIINTATANVNYYTGASGGGTATTITASNGFQSTLTYETV